MTQTIDEKTAETSPETDMVAAVLRVLAASPGPLTVSKLRAKLPVPFRSASLEELTDALQRQVAARVLFQYPKYRSQQDRFWDRPMEAHLESLFREALEEGPLGWVELRRKMPSYAIDPLTRAETVLTELVVQGALHRHPRSGKRGDRFGLQPADAKTYLQSELSTVFRDLEQLGFTEAQLRAAALELLHNEEWSPTPAEMPAAATPPSSQESAHAPSSSHAETDERSSNAAGPTTPTHDASAHPHVSPTANN